MNISILSLGVGMSVLGVAVLFVVDGIFPLNLALSIPGGMLAGYGIMAN